VPPAAKRQNPRFLAGGFSVGGTGIEPATSSVSGKRATAAPTAQIRRVTWCYLVKSSFIRVRRLGRRTQFMMPATGASKSQRVERWRRDLNPCGRLCRPLPRLSATPPYGGLPQRYIYTRADDEIRTRDPHLGKVMRYHCATSALSFDTDCFVAAKPALLRARKTLPERSRQNQTTPIACRHTLSMCAERPWSASINELEIRIRPTSSSGSSGDWRSW
jgi:hypothetical protein